MAEKFTRPVKSVHVEAKCYGRKYLRNEDMQNYINAKHKLS